MYQIIKKENLTNDTFLIDIKAPRIAGAALPGQFVIVKMRPESERIPLTICDHDAAKGCVTLVVKAIGKSTIQMSEYQVGDTFEDLVGPLGRPSEFVHLPSAELQKRKIVFIGGGVGIAPIYPQVKWLHQHGVDADVIIGARTKDMLILEKEMQQVAGNLYITTDDLSYGTHSLVTQQLDYLVAVGGKQYDEVIAIGPMIMMKYAVETAKKWGIKSTVSLNSMMVDGTGMCGACRVTVGGKTKFTCVDGPEFDGEEVDFEQALKRQGMYSHVDGKKEIEAEEKAENHECHIGGISEETRDRWHKVPVREQPAKVRATNFEEVCLGYNAEEAIEEAQRCLQCKKPACVGGCPVSIDIPGFVKEIAEGNFEMAARVINRDSALPAVCGRVCPQESQCEGKCVVANRGDAVSIGKLERFVGDWARENQVAFDMPAAKNGHKMAVIGSGPAGITCAKELLMMGYEVTIFEALHEYGGVLVYGIPSFRLPKESVVKHEIENVRKLGATFEKNVVVGRTVSIDQLMDDEHFEAVFIGSGAGLPNFMNIPGENLCGVVSANEFLTRNNLLFSYKSAYETPNYVGKKVVVVGGGNVAMDAARTALRLGAEVYIVYRRSEEELPARVEEVHHAKEEGIQFHLLCNPTEILGNEQGWVTGINCIRMELGAPDDSGRRRPVEIPNSQFLLESDMVIMSIGTSPNPLIHNTTSGLEVNRWGCIIANEEGATSRRGIFAGGDAVSGAATVILAMGAGKQAAFAMDNFIKNK
ncbi:MAG: bifunctional dihydroorotate dehydrogenase B NAD binding subunit/NADPH-dependent glutamate synthase [Bacteroidales bacterium]|jgi:glutamate synthase (NADPH/NADH) small chain|nr:bifunctional dihydroorotate dehydrogenase B NAD binding subunit/NADPH-dependent glutamate synthase [Bacteroidales bacterium]